MCSGILPPAPRNESSIQSRRERYLRRRGRLVNGHGEGREDRARLPGRHGAGPREVQQGRSVEARQHDAEAPLQRHLAEHLRRRDAGGEGGAGHSRLVPGDPPRAPALNSFTT